MAVTIGTAYQAENANEAAVTVASVVLAANDVADVTVAWRAGDDETISSLTFNGTTTGITQTAISQGAGERIRIAKYRIVGRTGTADVVATLNELASALWCGVQVLGGVDNTTPVGTTDTDVDLGAETGTLTSSVTLTSGDLAVFAIIVGVAPATLTEGGGQTAIFASNAIGAGAGDGSVAASYKTGSGSVSGGYTWDGGTAGWGRQIAVPYLQGAAAVTIAPGLGSQLHTGRAPTIGWSIGMPDVP